MLNLTQRFRSVFRSLLGAGAALLLFSSTVGAAPVDSTTARRVAENFIDYHLNTFGTWGASRSPSVAQIEPIEHQGAALFYAVTVQPSGYLLVAIDDDFSPVLLYSPTNQFNPSRASEEGSLESWFIPETFAVKQHLDRVNNALEMSAAQGKAAPAARKEQSRSWQNWLFFNRERTEFRSALGDLQAKSVSAGFGAKANKAPLLTTSWGQGSSRGPFTYNYLVPADPGTPTRAGCQHMVTGCVATALGQIMRYHQWPDRGSGSASYTWRPSSGSELVFSANFDRTYNWSSMPSRLTARSATAELDAVGRIMADLGVALEMDYGCTQSGSFPSKAQSILPKYFKYKDTISIKSRSDYATSLDFFNMLRAELDASPARPAMLSIYNAGQTAGHAVVVDGYQTGAQNMVHLNFGWDGSADDAYYDIDSNWTTAAGFYVWVPNGQFAVVGIDPDRSTCNIALGASTGAVAASGGTGSIAVSTGNTCGWSASSDVPWVTFVGAASGTSNGTLNYSVQPNTGNSARTATVSIGNARFTISQAGATCSYDLSPGSVTLPSPNSETGSVSMSTGSGCTWKATSNASWLSISNTDGAGSGSIGYTAEPNRTDSVRTATVSAGGKSISIIQPKQCTYNVSPQSLSLGAITTTGTIVVESGSGCAWSAVSSAPWLTINSGSSGTSYGRVEYTLAANEGAQERSATMTVGRQVITVKQAGKAAAPTNLVNPGFEDGVIGWEQTTLADVPVITYDRPNARTGYWYAWLGGYDNGKDVIKQTVSIPAGASASTLRFWYAAYTSEDQRGRFDTMKLEVFDTAGTRLAELWSVSNDDETDDWTLSPAIDLSAYKGKNIVLQLTAQTDDNLPTTFLIDDLALTSEQPCTYALSSTSVAADSNSAAGSITVTTSPATGCPWRATSSNSDWLLTTSTGSGSGTLDYRINDLAAPFGRSATINVADKSINVSQSAPVAGSEDLVVNGGFESGSDSWIASSKGGYETISRQAGLNTFAGVGLLWLSGYDSARDQVTQRVSIPARVTEAKLRFWYRIASDDVNGASAFDTMTVNVLSETGEKLKTLVTYSNADRSSVWKSSASFDLLEYKGRTIVLSFESTTDASGPTSFFVDNISLKALSPAAAYQTLNFAALSSVPLSAGSVPLIATASSGLPVVFVSQTPSICSIAGSNANLLSAGTCTLLATQPGNAQYVPAYAIAQSFVVKALQTISFPTVTSPSVSDGSITIAASSSSGLTVSFASTTPIVCTVSGTTVRLLQTGTCTIVASQVGDTFVAPATSVTQSFTIKGAPQTITFEGPKWQILANAQLALVASSSANLTVDFASQTPSVCTVNGATAVFVTVGTCTIVASQPGNSSTAPATSVTRSFEITAPSTLTVTFLSLTSSRNPANPGESFTLTARVTGRSPTGNVVFYLVEHGQTTSFCTQPLGAPTGTGNAAVATASCVVPPIFRSQATHMYAASYVGDANNTSAKGSLLQQINNQSARLDATVAPVKPIAGQELTITVTVFGNNPAGTVTFFDQGVMLPECALRPVVNLPGNTPSPLRVATCTIAASQSTVGERAILANYSGDGVNGAGSTALNFSIIPASAAPAFDYSDMWWGGASENGWGLSINQRGTVQFNALYIYDNAGNPTWAVMPGGRWNADFTVYSGDLYQSVSSPWFAYTTGHFAAGAPIGSAAIRFTSQNTAVLTYIFSAGSSLGSGAKNLTRQVLSNATTGGRLRVAGLWFSPTENGWGLGLAEQFGEIFGTWYTYDANGKPTWYVMPGGKWDGNTYSGDLYATRGSPWVGVAYNAQSLAVTKVGTLALSFADADSLVMTYTINGVSQTKLLDRQPF